MILESKWHNFDSRKRNCPIRNEVTVSQPPCVKGITFSPSCNLANVVITDATHRAHCVIWYFRGTEKNMYYSLVIYHIIYWTMVQPWHILTENAYENDMLPNTCCGHCSSENNVYVFSVSIIYIVGIRMISYMCKRVGQAWAMKGARDINRDRDRYKVIHK